VTSKTTSYWQTLRAGIRTSLKGLSLSLRHLKAARQRHAPTNVQAAEYFGQNTGMVTLRYPTEVIPVPDHGRYRLHNEMDDCIVCDKCAKICPVDCIEIEPVKATGEVGKASDGSPIRLYAARFDIDMAKCCYCGLCTTVCPTECLTMTKTYDYAEFDIRDMIYHFANLSPEQAEEKKRLYEQFVAEKEAAKASSAVRSMSSTEAEAAPKPAARPVFRPGVKKPAEATPSEAEAIATAPEPAAGDEKPKARPVFKPTMKKPEPAAPEPPREPEAAAPAAEPTEAAPKPRPVFKPTFKKPAETPAVSAEPVKPQETAVGAEPPAPKPRPVFKPTYKKPAAGPDNSADA
jgi:formate hydrogenlyase subunit 6/NADH:ubiquinone oxidoreductase subunit I